VTAGQPLLVALQFARCAFQRRAAYRLANWSGIAVNFFFFLVHAQVFLGFFAGRAEVAGWTPEEAVLYFATSESLLMVLGVMTYQAARELSDRIRSGDIALELARPARLWLRHTGEGYGDALYFVIARAAPLYVASTVLYAIAPPLRAELLLVPLSIGLAVGVAALAMYLATSTAFFWEQGFGTYGMLPIAFFFFGGIVVPLDFYPAGLRLVADVLPFRAAVYTPIALAAGKLTGGALAYGLAHQVVWLVVLAFAAHRVELAGERRVAAHGG
jgi:ABC-2 type transport system permease protein